MRSVVEQIDVDVLVIGWGKGVLIVGAHYLPFAFLYGMRLFLLLAAVLVVCGIAIALWLPNSFSAGGWVTGATLVVFAFLLRRSILRQAE